MENLEDKTNKEKIKIGSNDAYKKLIEIIKKIEFLKYQEIAAQEIAAKNIYERDIIPYGGM